jgi:outer membrane receptor protein involved in Fe transport
LAPSQAPNFSFGGNLTLLEAELAEDSPASTGAFPGQDGDRIPDVPEITGNFYADYSFPTFGGNWEAIARIDYSYVGESFRAFRSDDPRQRKQGDYSLVNLRVSFEDGDRYRIGIYANNVFDENAAVTHFVDANQRRPDQVTPIQPRTIGVSFGYRF